MQPHFAFARRTHTASAYMQSHFVHSNCTLWCTSPVLLHVSTALTSRCRPPTHTLTPDPNPNLALPPPLPPPPHTPPAIDHLNLQETTATRSPTRSLSAPSRAASSPTSLPSTRLFAIRVRAFLPGRSLSGSASTVSTRPAAPCTFRTRPAGRASLASPIPR